MVAQVHHQAFAEDGFFIVDDAVDRVLLAPMRDATVRIKTKVRAGQVDAFTQWAAPGEPFNILGILSPDFDESVFSEYMLCQPLMKAVVDQIGPDLRWEWLSLFTNPYHENFCLGLARGSGRRPAGPARSTGTGRPAPTAGEVPLGAGVGGRHRPQGGARQPLPSPHCA